MGLGDCCEMIHMVTMKKQDKDSNQPEGEIKKQRLPTLISTVV
jgi:hypothetical protein